MEDVPFTPSPENPWFHRPFPEQRAVLEAQLDDDLRHHNLPTLGLETRVLTQIVRLLRMATQTKPAEAE